MSVMMEDAVAHIRAALDADDKHLLVDCLLSIPDITSLLTHCSGHGVELLHEVCRRDYPDIVHLLSNAGADINLRGKQGTPLQIACQYRNRSVVDYLLHHGVNIRDEVPWDETSAFYRATLAGDCDILKMLVEAAPDMVADSHVQYALFYAACRSGHYNMVETWYTPELNVITPIQYVTALENCPNKTPMFAACASGSEAIVEFLLKQGAVITDSVCETFPEIIGSILMKSVTTKSDGTKKNSRSGFQSEELYMNWSAKKLQLLHHSWLDPFLHMITHLILNGNQLRSLPSCVPWGMVSLEELNVSHNRLTEIPQRPRSCSVPLGDMKLSEVFLQHNSLRTLPVSLFQIPALSGLYVHHNQVKVLCGKLNGNICEIVPADPSSSWTCSNLKTIDVCHNELTVLPSQISQCTGLIRLNASFNCLTHCPAPWHCHLEYLDLSSNKISTLATTLNPIWSHSLRVLNLSHNKLSELPESIVTFASLAMIDVSDNEIDHLPSPDVWQCTHLAELNLSSNRLSYGTITETKKSPLDKIAGFFSRNAKSPRISLHCDEVSQLELPAILADCLTDLLLSNNNLRAIPPSIFHFSELRCLNLQNNPHLTIIPNQLGKLSKCKVLKFDGCPITNIPRHLLQDAGALLEHLEVLLRDSEPCHHMKLMILGKQGKGKTSLERALRGDKLIRSEDNKISIHTWKLTPDADLKKRLKPMRRDCPAVTFSMWDMPGLAELQDVFQCFLTSNTLYLLIWDVTTGTTGLDGLKPCLLNIQSRVTCATIIIVGTHKDNLAQRDMATIEDKMWSYAKTVHKWSKTELNLAYMPIVSCTTNEGIATLRENIYCTVIQMMATDSMFMTHQKLFGRKIPKSYLDLQNIVRNEALQRSQQAKKPISRPPVLDREEMAQLISKVPGSDLMLTEHVNQAISFLHEQGDLLHFGDNGADCVYFIDADWLAALLSHIVLAPTFGHLIKNGVLERIHFDKLLLNNDSALDISKCINVLEKFELGLLLDYRRLLLPAKLSDGRPAFDLVSDNSVHRFYKMVFIPSGFWSRLITKILIHIPQFTGSSWRVETINPNTRSGMKSMKHSFRGFTLQHHRTMYWKEGILILHDGGYILVEAADWCEDHNLSQQKGILVTIQSDEHDYSGLGFIKDEIEGLFIEWYRGLDQPEVYAVCSACASQSPDDISNPLFLGSIEHFTVPQCAHLCRYRDSIICPRFNKDVPLGELVPDLLLSDLPKTLHLDRDKLQIDLKPDSILGHGSFGKVCKGTYDGEVVAVKLFSIGIMDTQRIPDRNCQSESLGDHADTVHSERHRSSIVSSHQISLHYEMTSKEEEIGSKIYESLSDLRTEVMILSKLRHPCILAMVGVCLNPLCLVVELAPLGSLKGTLNKHMDPELKDIRMNQVQGKVFSTVFSKYLTYKIVYQIVKALEYLHRHGVIYRDLKPDNVLVFSLDEQEVVNVKLSDYGISNFATPQGSTLICGSMGYQAPEISRGTVYDEKVDMFSLGMVIFEVMTGLYPYNRDDPNTKIIRDIQSGKRPKLQTNIYNIQTKFPRMEYLMRNCWANDPSQRPDASQIIAKMKQLEFLCESDTFELESHRDAACLGCVMAFTVSEPADQSLMWLWVGEQSTLRRYSIVDVKHGTYRLPWQICAGPKVNCMVKIGNHMCAGTQGSTIEFYGCQMSGDPKCVHQVKTNGPVTSLVYQEQPSNDSSQGLLFASLSTGSITIYKLSADKSNSDFPLSVTKLKTLTLSSTDGTIHTMTQIGTISELWVSCDHEIVIISMNTLMIEMRIRMGDVVHLRTNQARLVDISVGDLVTDEETIWAALLDHHMLIQFDVASRTPLFLFDFSDAIAGSIVKSFRLGNGMPASSVQRDKAPLRRQKSLPMEINLSSDKDESQNLRNPKMVVHKDTLWLCLGTSYITVVYIGRCASDCEFGELICRLECDRGRAVLDAISSNAKNQQNAWGDMTTDHLTIVGRDTIIASLRSVMAKTRPEHQMTRPCNRTNISECQSHSLISWDLFSLKNFRDTWEFWKEIERREKLEKQKTLARKY